MNLLLSSEINSLDIAYKTTTKIEYDELLDYYNRYIKLTVNEDIELDKNYLFETLSYKFERLKIYENENELVIKTNNNSYNCFIWNTGKKNENKLRISGILSVKEFENSKHLKSEIENRTNLIIEFNKGGNGYYDTVWATSSNFIETQNMNNIYPKELISLTENIEKFITEIQKIKNSQ
jgi:predicted metallopeptidase